MLLPLTAPALFAAGLGSGGHCALMCGALGAHALRGTPAAQLRAGLLQLHGGRVLGYALLGALAGSVGTQLIGRLPAAQFGSALQLLAALALVCTGVVAWRRLSRPACCVPQRADPSQRSLFMRGLLWAALPCGILYGVLALCALAGDAARGALLAAAFGLGTVPGAALGSGSLGTLLRRAGLPSAAPAGALLLIALGLLQAAVVVLHRSLDPAWCRWLA